MEARVVRLREQHPELSLLHLTTDDLNQPDRVRDLLEFLNLPHLADSVLPRVGLRVNEKRDEKQRTVDREQAIAMNEQLVKMLRDRFDSRYIQVVSSS